MTFTITVTADEAPAFFRHMAKFKPVKASDYARSQDTSEIDKKMPDGWEVRKAVDRVLR